MSGKTFRKLLSVVLAPAMALGLMVIILEEGPTEIPYYDGSIENPVTSPNVAALYQTETQASAAEPVAAVQPVSTESVAYQTQAEYPSNPPYASPSE